MVEYSDIQGELNTQWNAVVIAKPSFVNWDLKGTSKYPATLMINVQTSTFDPLGPSGLADIVETVFFIKIVSANRANHEKYIQEIKRIIHTKSISGGDWRIKYANKPQELQKRVIQTLTGRESLFVANEDWS